MVGVAGFEPTALSPPVPNCPLVSITVGQKASFLNSSVSAGFQNDCPTFGEAITPFSAAVVAAKKAVFRAAAKEITKPNFRKSYAQVASSVAHPVAHGVAPHSTAGLRPRPPKQNVHCTHGLRLRPGELDLIRTKAAELDMTVNAYIRAKALGEDYIEKPPSWMRDALLKLYVELAAQGNNLNQLARNVNRGLLSAESALATADRQRLPLFMVMEHIQTALAGRRPPHDY